MLLPPQDVKLFFRLHRTLMIFVNQRLSVIPVNVTTAEEFAALSPENRLKLRDALNANLDLIELFVAENPARMSEDDLAVVRSWRHLVAGTFYIVRKPAKYTVFLSSADPEVAYGVLALTQPFEDLTGPHLPAMTKAVLLPFKGVIVYDGLLHRYRASFGPGARRSLTESYKEAKLRYGIVTTLPMPDKPILDTPMLDTLESGKPMSTRATKATPVPKPPTRQDNDQALAAIVELMDQFCKEHLNDEYAELCRKMAEKLARKRPSPLLMGNPRSWASGIVRAVGGVNFLHDKSQTPYMRSTDINRHLGTSSSSAATKLAAIRKMLKIYQGDPKWTLPSQLDDNLLVWMLHVNGIFMDVRRAPREIQEIAFKKGLIPYIPADRQQEG